MGRELRLVDAQASEIDDPLDSGPARGFGKVCGGPAVAFIETLFATGHRMDQVIGNVDIIQSRRQGFGLEDIALDNFNPIPGGVLEIRRMAHQAAETVTGLQEARDKPSADVAGGAGDQDSKHLAKSDLASKLALDFKESNMKSKNLFARFATSAARRAGQPAAFATAFLIIIAWALCGPLFGFSDTWQLVINTSTTIVTFLMVFLIQNTQNRDSEAMHLKLDELLRSHSNAFNALMDLEELDEAELDKLRDHYEELARQARAGKNIKGSPQIDLS